MSYLITIHIYYVGFISICNGIIGADAVGLPVLFTDCAKVIGQKNDGQIVNGQTINEPDNQMHLAGKCSRLPKKIKDLSWISGQSNIG